MMKSICLSLFFLSVIGCKKEVKNLPEDFNFGEAKNNVYTNPYFGLTFEYPSDWSVQSKRDIKAITVEGNKYLASDHSQLKSALKASQINIAYLFSIFRYPLKSPKQGYNASLSLVAENITGNPKIMRGRDYLFNSKELLKQTPALYEFEDGFDTKTIDGNTFDVLRANVSYGGYKVDQEFFCIVRDGFSLSFILSYTNGEEQVALYKIINAIEFE